MHGCANCAATVITRAESGAETRRATGRRMPLTCGPGACAWPSVNGRDEGRRERLCHSSISTVSSTTSEVAALPRKEELGPARPPRNALPHSLDEREPRGGRGAHNLDSSFWGSDRPCRCGRHPDVRVAHIGTCRDRVHSPAGKHLSAVVHAAEGEFVDLRQLSRARARPARCSSSREGASRERAGRPATGKTFSAGRTLFCCCKFAAA